MASLVQSVLVGLILIARAGAQGPPQPALRQGISVDMPHATHAVEMRAADEPNATTVAITADGTIFVDAQSTEPAALNTLTEETVYLKADARVPYQKVLTVLDALRGKTVVLLTAPPANAVTQQRFVPPYGMKLIVPK